MSDKPIIFVLLKYYLPGYKSGGPVRSVQGLAEHLGERNEVKVLAYDRDLGDKVPYSCAQNGVWNEFSKTKVAYLPMSGRRWAAMRHFLRNEQYDILYLQSLFDSCFTLWPLVLRRCGQVPKGPVLLAPRGELSKGALSIKGGKKGWFLSVARLFGLYDGIHWQASSELEADEIRNSGLVRGGEIHVARNLRVPVVTQRRDGRGASGSFAPLRLVFVSRLAPKKNLEGALRALLKVSSPVTFDIYGPIDLPEEAWEECQRLMGILPCNVVASYHGPAEPSHIADVFLQADGFLFPTLGENFGHVIVEALLAGCPVLTSDRTPWEDLSAAGCGVNLAPDDTAGFTQAIENLAVIPPQAREEMRIRAKKFGIEGLRVEASIFANKKMFKRLLQD
jgi:glycosyltransferase involved in cell wall biosynthesis